MEKMKLKEFWESRQVADRNKILMEMAEKCHNSIETVRSWMLGYRNPKGLYKEILFAYIRENFQTEIIEEGGKQ